jgi:hypothetical protein
MTMNREEQDMRELDIAAYLDGRLTGAARDALERILEDDCGGRNALALAKSVNEGPVEGGNVPDRLVQKVRQLYPRDRDIFDLVLSLAGSAIKVISASADTIVTAPASAGAVRSVEAGAFPLVVMTKVFNRASVDVNIERLAGSACTFTVRATDTTGGGPLQSARAELLSGWRELASSPLEQGTAQFEDVQKGHYEVIIRKHDAVIVRMSVKIIGN